MEMNGASDSEASFSYSFDDFLHGHKAQLEAASVPIQLWPALFEKLINLKFDAGNHFQIVKYEEGKGVFAIDDIDHLNEESVFLIDHAWTFSPSQARKFLENVPGLVERMAALFGSDNTPCGSEVSEESDEDEVIFENEKKERISECADVKEIDGSFPRQDSVDANLCRGANDDLQIDRLLKEIWRYAHTYTMRKKEIVDEEGMPVWYVMDEFGSLIGHSETPNCRVVPFFFTPHECAYSLLFLTKSLEKEAELCRDYVDTTVLKKNPSWRHILMYPWFGGEFDEPLERLKPTKDFFLSGRKMDDLPNEEEKTQCRKVARKTGGKLKVYSDSAQMLNNLDKVEVELVEDWHEADVIWMSKHFHDYRKLCTENPKALINQFPYESCLTVKDLLAANLQAENGDHEHPWFQTCFNLTTELPLFCNYFKEREMKGLENTWIVKPWNLARGLDMHVSNDLAQIIRLIEAGPKVACKYIANPVLFKRPDNQHMVKFDLRFIVFVESLRPVKAYVYKKFWTRFAINQFTLTRLDDPETHFTVFNYADKNKILQMQCEEFVKQIENTHKQLKWVEVEKKIYESIRGLLEAASKDDPPCGVAENPQSRAMYGVDVMLQWNNREKTDLGVSILECNFMPDCERACLYYEDFADTVFETLFLGNINSEKVITI
ncbi:unnamed protein product, partial [Mesorhabditis belari]|uniref:SET domain-containing protein n=1 Tax=Mesorhabditis belari TaxID=2138241 RepID=A0AAF3EWZ6_9BILA